MFAAGCGQSPHSMVEKYYLVVPNAKSPYWEQVSAGLNQAARELKVSISVSGPDTYDPAAERQEFKTVAASKPAAILISVADPKLLTPEIDAAVAAGILVITVDSDAALSKRLFFVGTNNYEAGQIGGQANPGDLFRRRWRTGGDHGALCELARQL
jgi:ribose transport system substrate-binding protein